MLPFTLPNEFRLGSLFAIRKASGSLQIFDCQSYEAIAAFTIPSHHYTILLAGLVKTMSGTRTQIWNRIT